MAAQHCPPHRTPPQRRLQPTMTPPPAVSSACFRTSWLKPQLRCSARSLEWRVQRGRPPPRSAPSARIVGECSVPPSHHLRYCDAAVLQHHHLHPQPPLLEPEGVASPPPLRLHPGHCARQVVLRPLRHLAVPAAAPARLRSDSWEKQVAKHTSPTC